MSADNWAPCPRCIKRAESFKADLLEEMNTSYGRIPLAEFDALRQRAEAPVEEKRTFREDYEIYGAVDGTIVVSYRGHCSECGLALEFTHEVVIPGVEE